MRDLLVTLIVFGTLPIILKQPHVGILVWSWLGYMNPHRLTWGFAYDFPFAQVVAITLFIAILFSREPKRIPWNPIVVLWIVFVCWMGMTTVFAFFPEYAKEIASKVFKIQLFSFLTLMLMGTEKRLNALIWVIVLSLGYFGVKNGIFAVLSGGTETVWGPSDTMIEGNNELALALIMVIPLMRYLQLSMQKRWASFTMGGAIMLSILSVIASYSRGALLAVAAMGMVLLWKGKRRALLVVILVLAVPAILAFVPEKWSERMGTISTYEEDASALGRINAWWFAFNLAKDRPLIGGGFETFQAELFPVYAPDPEDWHDAHSIYFEVLGEHGFVALGLFLALGAMALRGAGRIVRLTEHRDELKWANNLGRMLQASLIGYAVGGVFLQLAYFDLYYHLIAMVVLTDRIVKGTLQGEAGVLGHVRIPQQTGQEMAGEGERYSRDKGDVWGSGKNKFLRRLKTCLSSWVNPLWALEGFGKKRYRPITRSARTEWPCTVT